MEAEEAFTARGGVLEDSFRHAVVDEGIETLRNEAAGVRRLQHPPDAVL